MSEADRKADGRSTRAYTEIADAIMLERQVASSAKRARLQEEREEAIRESDSKRLKAIEERGAQETKRKAIAEAAASFTASDAGL